MPDRTSDSGRKATISCAAAALCAQAVAEAVRGAGHAYLGALVPAVASAFIAIALAYLGALTWDARQ